MSKLTIPTIAIAAALAFSSPAIAEEDDGRLLPNEEELQQLGDMAERMMREFADRMAPMAERLRELVDDLDAYEAPEMLPNGDIIIRRKPDADPPRTADRDDEDGVEL